MYWFEEYNPKTNEMLYGIQFGTPKNKGYKSLSKKSKRNLFNKIIFIYNNLP